jgi:hypothetical protein
MTPATLAEGLSEAMRSVLRASAPHPGDARIFVPAYVERKRWPHDLIDTYSAGFRRLTPTGLALRAYLKEQAK